MASHHTTQGLLVTDGSRLGSQLCQMLAMCSWSMTSPPRAQLKSLIKYGCDCILGRDVEGIKYMNIN